MVNNLLNRTAILVQQTLSYKVNLLLGASPLDPSRGLSRCALFVHFLLPLSVRSISLCAAHEAAVANLCVVCGHHSQSCNRQYKTQIARRTTSLSSGRPFSGRHALIARSVAAFVAPQSQRPYVDLQAYDLSQLLLRR